MRKHPVLFFACVTLIAAGAATYGLSTVGWPPLLGWLASLNVLAMALWAWDKFRARREGFRVPEAALHLVAFAGAVPGSWLAMRLFRHKTLKPKFRWLYVVFLVLQLTLAALWIWPELRPWGGGPAA